MPSKSRKSKTESRSRWEIRRARLADLEPSAYNPRKIDGGAMRALSASLRRFGYVEPIVWNERTGRIVGGHQRHSLLMDQGVEEAPVVVVDFSDEEEVAANLTLNNPEIEGEWDDPILDLISRLEDSRPELFGELDFGGLRDAVEAMAPKTGEESYEGKNREVDVDDLTSDCDVKCPCCSFEWEIDAKDVEAVVEPQAEEEEDDE